MCYPASGVLSTCEILSVDSLLAIINELYSHCDDDLTTSGGSHDHSTQPSGSHNHPTPPSGLHDRSGQPTPEDLLLLRQRKKVISCHRNEVVAIV